MREARYRDIGAGRQTVDPCIEGLNIAGTNGTIGPEGWIDARLNIRTGDPAVIFEAVGWIVGSTNGPYLKAFENSLSSKLIAGQQRVSAFPNFGRCIFVEQLVN